MPVITNPPVEIDPVNFSRESTNETGVFEFAVGTNAYQVLLNNQVPVTARISIYKSTDGGNTWNEMDQAGTPANINGELIAFQESGGNIDILFRRAVGSGGGLQIVEFDTGTDTYGTPTAANGINDTVGVFYRQSGGTYVFVYSDGALKYVTNTAGVWAGPTTLRAATALLTGVSDSSDRCHLFTNESGFILSYRQLSAAFSLGTNTDFTGNVFFNGGGSAIILGPDSVAVLYGRTSGTEEVQIGTPLSAPVFTAYDGVFPIDALANYSYPLLVEGSDGKLNAFITRIENPDVIDEIQQAVFDGVSTWAAPIVFYDELTNPPADSISSLQFIHTASAVQVGGNWIYATAMETTNDGGITTFCTGFALLSGVPVTTQTLQLNKVVQGGPAQPSDFTLIATGGSPEVEISGPGPTVGPTEVSPGVFELSEIAPGGATWNDETMTWDDNTNTWDGGDYTPVWDCGGALMPTPTSVVVGSGGGTPVVTATQVPEDPTYRSLLSGGRIEFPVGDSVYQVLYSTMNRIGMFKRAANAPGTPWTLMDDFGSPEQGNQSGYGRVTIDAGGTIISVAYAPIGRLSIAIASFDTATDTWGAHTAALALPGTVTTFAFMQQASGDFTIFAATPLTLFYHAVYSGGWGPIVGQFPSGGKVLDGVIDAGGNYHLLFNIQTSGVGNGVTYWYYDSSFTPNSPFPVAAGMGQNLAGYPSITQDGTSVMIGFIDNAGLPARKVQVMIGTPLSAASFTNYIIDTPVNSSESFGFVRPALDLVNALHVFYTAISTAVSENEVRQSDFDGVSTWTAPVVFYDGFANRPDNSAPDDAISALDPVELVGGWAIAASMQTIQPTEVATGEVLESTLASSVVVCTVTNVFNGPPPTPPGPGQSNPVGCFELIRVDATLMPARHLPTRGSVK